MQDISSLTISASHLLLALLLYSDFNDQPKTTQMLLCGIGKEITYRQARRELERAGFLRLEQRPGRRHVMTLVQCTFLSSAAYPGGVGVGLDSKYIYSILEGSLTGSTGHSNGAGSTLEGRPLRGGRTPMVVPSEDYQGSTLRVPPSLVVVPSEYHQDFQVMPSEDYHPTLVDRCREADEMDDSGAITSTKSPFGIRRLAQIPLIQEAYKHYFPQDENELNPINAKTWLSCTNNRSEDVVERLQDIAQRKPDGVPIAYITKVFKGEAQRTAEPVLSSAVSVLERPKVGAGAYIPGGDLPLPSPEYLAQLQAAQQNFERMKAERGWAE